MESMELIIFIFAMFVFHSKCSRIIFAHNRQVINQNHENQKKEHESLKKDREIKTKMYESKFLIRQI